MQPGSNSQPAISTATVQKKKSRFWRIVAWMISIVFLTAGIGSLVSEQFASGIFCILFGAVLFPPLNLRVRERTNGAFNRKVTAVLAAAFFIPLAFFANKEVEAQRSVAARKAAVEQHYRDSIQALAEEKHERDAAAKKMFLENYPFVDSDAYDYWLLVNQDSATTDSHTLNAFLTAEKRKYDLMLAKKHTDSIEAARSIADAEKKRNAEEVKTETAASESSSPKSSSSREAFEYKEEYFQGHQVYTGPRGGKYIIVNGKKKYLSSM